MSKLKYNKNMIYNEFKPDFLRLIKEYPELKKYLINKDENKEIIENTENNFSFDWSNNDLSLLINLNYFI